jgi:hypothetical protein
MKKVFVSTNENIVIKPKALIGINGKIKNQSKFKNKLLILEEIRFINY